MVLNNYLGGFVKKVFLLFFSLILNQNLILVKVVSEKVHESINIVEVFIK